jgi:transposase
MADLNIVDWEFAVALARDGDFSQLDVLLRGESEIPLEARRFIADLLKQRARPGGAPRKLTYHQKVSIRATWRHNKAWKDLPRGELRKMLAKKFRVSESTIKSLVGQKQAHKK